MMKKMKLQRLILILTTMMMFPAFSFGQMAVRGTVRMASGSVLRTKVPVLLKDSLNPTYRQGLIRNAGTLSLQDSLVFYSGEQTDGMVVPMDGAANNLTGYDQKKVVVVKNIAQRKGQWFAISFPFDLRMADILAANPSIYNGINFSVTEYDSQSRADRGVGEFVSNWKTIPRNATLYKGTGYTIKVSNTYPDTVLYFPAADQSQNIASMLKYGDKDTDPARVKGWTGATGDPAHFGWNYIGSLSPCSFDLSESGNLAWAGLGRWNGTIYYLDNSGNWIDELSGVDEPLVASPFVGFFVQIGDQTPGLLTFNAQGLSSRSTVHPYFRAAEVLQTQKICLGVVDGDGAKDQFNIWLSDMYTENYDPQDDAVKAIGNPDPLIRTWAIQKGRMLTKVALPHRNESREISVGFNAPKAGEYTFSIDDKNDALQSALLEDKVLGIKTELLSESYAFSVDGQIQVSDRFLMTLTEKGAEKSTNLPALGTDGIYAYIAHSFLTVKNLTAGDRIRVSDVAGRIIASGIAPNDTYSTPLTGKGMYVVSVVGNRNAVIKVMGQ